MVACSGDCEGGHEAEEFSFSGFVEEGVDFEHEIFALFDCRLKAGL